ncbi:MAG: phenylalanine--tRNA ligase subunit beta [Sphaerochaeta sp.]
MPKIETKEKSFFNYLGKSYSDDELEEIFPVAKAELDGHSEGVIKIELNDTNRPDLWSAIGVARAIKNYESGEVTEYDFFSSKEQSVDNEGRELQIHDAPENRAYSIGFAVKGHVVSDDDLLALIQSQEKLCFNFGRKRKTIAMGIYRSDLIQFPVHYQGADPDKTSFQPLGMDEVLTLREITKKHPKGIEYGPIVENDATFPYLYDDNGNALSFPPVINSADLGAVQVGDDALFVEMSGPILKNLLLAASIMSCDMADMGFEICPVKVVFDSETEFGKEITVPYYYQEPISCTMEQIEKTTGVKMSGEKAVSSLAKMGLYSFYDAVDEIIYATVPEYRDDFLHAADLVEDVIIGYGLNNFTPEMPHAFTMGRLTPAEELGRKVKDILVGLGFQEMMYNYLGSKKAYVDNMEVSGDDYIQIANPMSENYEYVRPSVIPSLLESESISAHATYPHKIFEVGKIAYLYPQDNSGTITKNSLGFLAADSLMGFNEVSSMVNTLMYFLRVEYKLESLNEDNRFISGRGANIISGGKKIGIFGEINPTVLENWGCGMPTIACEIDLDEILSL